MSSLPSIPSWFSLQDSFEYISQDPQVGKLNTNQNSLGPCRTGSNLGKMRRWSGCSPRAAPGAVLCLTWVGCVWVWVCVLFNLCFFVCVCVPCVSCVFCSRSAAGVQRQTAAGGVRRRTAPAHPQRFFLCRFVWNAEHSVCGPHTLNLLCRF